MHFVNEEPLWAWQWDWERCIATSILSHCCDPGKLRMAGPRVRTVSEKSKTSAVWNVSRRSRSGLCKRRTNSVVFWAEFLASSPLQWSLWRIWEHRLDRFSSGVGHYNYKVLDLVLLYCAQTHTHILLFNVPWGKWQSYMVSMREIRIHDWGLS